MKFIGLSIAALMAMLKTSAVTTFSLSKNPSIKPDIKSKPSNNSLNSRNAGNVDLFVLASKTNESTVNMRESARDDAVLTVKSLKDYQELIVDEVDKVTILRFSAPWCRVCKSTSIAYERLAKKLSQKYSSRVKFLSIDIDGTSETNALKESLKVKQVPTGLIFHPNVGVLGQIKLGRTNLGELRKRLHRFLESGETDSDLTTYMEGLIDLNTEIVKT